MQDSLSRGRKAHMAVAAAEAPLRFSPGSLLFDREHPSTCVYLLRSGQVQLWCGRGAIVDQLHPGDFFAQQCLLAAHSGAEAARAISPVVVLPYRLSALLDRVRQDPRFALRLLRNTAVRLDRYEQTIRDFVVEAAESRLAHTLCRLLPARPTCGWVRLRSNPTNPELARMIGTTRWRVSGFLSHFQRLGWLRRDRGFSISREGLSDFLGSTERAKGRL